jgi:16S rRNA (guanine527-N7)-methyltransferase
MQSLAATANALFGINLNERQILTLEAYAEELTAWNAKFNLTAITDREGIRTKHFLDSLSCLSAGRFTAGMRVADVGTGAGFPGLVIKIAMPGLRMTLIEATGKKADFCRGIADRLELRDVDVVHARAEEAGQDPAHREQYDWVVARAVADLPVLAEYLLPLAKVGGSVLAQKGETGPAEAHAAEQAFRILGGSLRQVTPVELPGVAETRYLIVMTKEAPTPPQYPRRPGVPAKQPLGGKRKTT